MPPPTVLALDLSSSCTGYALLQGDLLLKYGSLDHEKGILQYGEYPFCYLDALGHMTQQIDQVVGDTAPDVVVIEETNKSRARYSQKALEFLHLLVLQSLRARGYGCDQVKYVSTGVWRRAVGIELSLDQKRQNARLAKAKRAAAAVGERLNKKALGIAGKISKKHVAVAWANHAFQLGLKTKQNDVADALGLAVAYVRGAKVCDGK